MKNKSSNLITTCSKVFNGEIIPKCKTVEQYIKLIEKTDKHLPVNNTFIIITNPQTQSYEFISNNFKAVTDITPKELVNYCVSNVELIDRKKLDVQYNYRFQKGDGNYINILESQIALQLDKEGKPLINIGHLLCLAMMSLIL